MSDERNPEAVLHSLTDELKVQAWLANKELTHPSLHREETRKEVNALARLRDELRVQLHLGQLDAEQEWHDLEGLWRRLMAEAKPRAERAADSVDQAVQSILTDLRDGYAKLTKDD